MSARTSPRLAGRARSATTGTGPSTCASGGKRGGGDQFVDGVGGTRHLSDRDGRWETERAAFGELALGVTDRIPSNQRLHGSQRAVGEHDNPTTISCRANQSGCVQPAPQCFLTGSQVGPLQECPTVEQQGRPVAALGDRFGARRRDHQSGARRHGVEHLALRRRADHDARECDGRALLRCAAPLQPLRGTGGCRTRDTPTRPRSARTIDTSGRSAHRWWRAAPRRPGIEEVCGSCRTTAPAGSRGAAPESAPAAGRQALRAPTPRRASAADRPQRAAGPRRGRRQGRPSARSRVPRFGSAQAVSPTPSRPAWLLPQSPRAHRPPPQRSPSARAASAPRGRAGRAHAARRAGHHRRPTSLPDRGRAPAQRQRRECRRPRSTCPLLACRKRRYRCEGPRSAVSTTCRSGPRRVWSAVSTLRDVAPIGDDDYRATPARNRRRDKFSDLRRPARAGQRGPHRAGRSTVAQRGQELPTRPVAHPS